jgi:hypothetical protein
MSIVVNVETANDSECAEGSRMIHFAAQSPLLNDFFPTTADNMDALKLRRMQRPIDWQTFAQWSTRKSNANTYTMTDRLVWDFP